MYQPKCQEGEHTQESLHGRPHSSIVKVKKAQSQQIPTVKRAVALFTQSNIDLFHKDPQVVHTQNTQSCACKNNGQ